MTRATAKNTINKILRTTTNGLHCDECWLPVYKAFEAIKQAGFELEISESKYAQDANGNPASKIWKYEITYGSKPIYGVLTAHGAGTVADPLSKYDISAYVN